jgi:hypothetical protein
MAFPRQPIRKYFVGCGRKTAFVVDFVSWFTYKLTYCPQGQIDLWEKTMAKKAKAKKAKAPTKRATK